MNTHVNPISRATTANAKLPANLVRDQEQQMETRPKAEARLPFPVAYIRRSRRQENDSIERQKERAQEYCRRVFGMDVQEFYTDKGKSGEFRNRAELNRLKDDVKSGRITAVIVEELDRMGRNMALIAVTCEYFSDRDIVVHSLTKNGPIEKVDIAFKGFMAEEFQSLLRARIASGIKSVHNDGRLTTKAFGYDKVPGRPGEREVDERACAAIQWMFQARLDGMSFTEIAKALNEYSPPLKSVPFNINMVKYVLANSLYAGLYVYGRQKFTRDKETDARISEPVPHYNWRVVEVPHMQIVPMEVFDAVYATLTPVKKARVADTFLSGKVTFGAERWPALYMHERQVYEKNPRTSERVRTVECDWISTFVLDSLRTLLQSDELEGHFQRSLTAAFEASVARVLDQRSIATEALAKVDQQLKAALDKRVSTDFSGQFLDKRVRELSDEYDALSLQLANMPLAPTPPLIDPGRRLKLLDAFDGVVDRFRANGYRLKLMSAADVQIANTIRGMVNEVHCEPIPGSMSVRCIVTFRLDKVFGVMRSSIEAEDAVHSFSKVRHFATRGAEWAAFREALLVGRHALTDDEFDTLVRENRSAISATLNTSQQAYLRKTLDRQMAIMTLSQYWDAMRDCDPVADDRLECTRLMRHMFRSGLWNMLLQTIETRFPARYQDLNVTLYDCLLVLKPPWRKRKRRPARAS